MITIYGTEICSYCIRSKKLAEQYNLKYEWKDADENEAELKERIGQYETIPQIFWHDRHIGGYTEFVSEIENTSGGYGDGNL